MPEKVEAMLMRSYAFINNNVKEILKCRILIYKKIHFCRKFDILPFNIWFIPKYVMLKNIYTKIALIIEEIYLYCCFLKLKILE